MIQGKLLSFGDDLKDVIDIRRRVFVDECNVAEEREFDNLDSSSIHVLVYEEASTSEVGKDQKTAVATGRIQYDGQVCNIGHIAVLKEFRNKKYGDFTVRMLLNKAFTSGIEEVIVYSPFETTKFFNKLGFKFEVEGDKNNNLLSKMVIKSHDVKKICKL